MPQSTDLTGAGLPPLLASLLGNQANALVTTGTSQTTAATIKTHNTELTTASSQTGAILPSNALVGTPYFVACPTSTSGVIYAPVGQTLNGSLNGSVTVAQNKCVILWQYKLNNWVSNLTA